MKLKELSYFLFQFVLIFGSLCSLIHKELEKVSEMALDFFAEFRQFDTNKKSAEFSSKIVAEDSAKKPVHFV